jgi:hypothetical protein
MTYTWKEMVELDCLFEALREAASAVFTAATLADQLAGAVGSVRPENRPAFESGLAKLRHESPDMLSAWVAGKASWRRTTDPNEKAFELYPESEENVAAVRAFLHRKQAK